MKYSPEEILEYVKANGMQKDLLNCLYNNNIDFEFGVFPVKLIKDAGKYRFVPDIPDMEELKEQCEIATRNTDFSAISPSLLKSVMKGSGQIVQIISGQDKLHVQTVFLENGESEVDAYDSAYLDFIRAAGIDTHGRLKQAIKRADEMMEEFVEDYILPQ